GAGGLDPLGFAGIEGQHHIEIVDHEIENHIHVGASSAEAAQAVAFDKDRPTDVRTHALHDRIEAFAVSDLKPASALRRKLDQLARLAGSYCDGLFDEDVFAGLQTGFCNGVM